MSVEPRPRGARRDPAQRRVPRPVRASRTGRATQEAPRSERVDPLQGLGAAVAHILGLLRDRRGALDSGLTRDVIARLRHFAHEAPDPRLRAVVHVACAHLSAGDLEEARFALGEAAQRLGLPVDRGLLPGQGRG